MRVRFPIAALAAALATVALAGCDLPLAGADPSGITGGKAINGSSGGGFIITKTNADPATVYVAPGQTMTLSIETSRPAKNVHWIATGGYLSSNAGNPVTWTAPQDAGSYTVGVSASDGTNSADAAYRFNVNP